MSKQLSDATKIREYDIILRKEWEELDSFLNGVNSMILQGCNCILKYESQHKLLRIKIYRCRSRFSAIRLSFMLKEKDINLNEIKTLLTYTNLVSSYNGFLQFSISKPAEEQHGPTVHIDIYEPKDSAKKNLLKQALESIE